MLQIFLRALMPVCCPTTEMSGEIQLFSCADAADGAATHRADALRDRLAVLGCPLNGILHNLLFLALHAVRFDCHSGSSLLVLIVGPPVNLLATTVVVLS